MDIGLYQLKHPVRKMIAGALPLVRRVEPNTISWSLVPVGAAAAIAYYFAANGAPSLYILGIALISLRMFLGTLDGLAATHYDKGTDLGEMVNRTAPELCDVMLLVALAAARPEWRLPGIAALALAWLTTYAGLIGAVIGRPVQSVGPVGKTDRLVALQVMSLAAFLSSRFGWGIDAMRLFLVWCAVGGIVTVALRLHRHFRGGAMAPRDVK